VDLIKQLSSESIIPIKKVAGEGAHLYKTPL
jgi:hypothetical protein